MARSAENVPDYAAVDRVDTLTAETAHETKAAASPGTTYDKANPRSSDTTHKGQNREPVPKSHANWERNTALRRAFLADTPEISRRTTEKLSSPFVPAPREYKSKSANRAMELKLLGRARAQVGFDAIAEHLSLRTPLLGSIFSTLQCISPEGSGQKTKISAIRIVMPAGYDLDAVNRNLTLIGSASGVSNRLRLTTDYRNSSTFVLRGLSSHIARAADELVAANKDVKVYKLGEVGAVDYETKQLWPVLEESTDTTMVDDSGDKIWIHKEYSNYWINQPYEKIRKPEKWTRESLEEYILKIVCGRLRPHVVLRHYKTKGRHGRTVDLPGIRTNLIREVVDDPNLRTLITPALLKKVLQFISRQASYHFSAGNLLELADKWGMPIDTDVCNILLESHVARRNPTLFHRELKHMEEAFFSANARTWLLFLELVEQDEARRNIILAMYEKGLFNDGATRRRVAQIMIRTDAYRAFKAGKNMQQFFDEQDKRYGKDWFTRTTLNYILEEFFMHHQTSRDPDFPGFKLLLERPCQDGQALQLSTINIIIKHCAHPESIGWNTAFWALRQLHLHNLEPDRETVYYLILLAMRTRCSAVLSVLFWYGTLSRKLHTPSRLTLRSILLRRHPHPFWKAHPPKLLTESLADELAAEPVNSTNQFLGGIERKILPRWEWYTMEQNLADALWVAWQAVDLPMHARLNRARKEAAKGAGTVQKGAAREEQVTAEATQGEFVQKEADEELPILTLHVTPPNSTTRENIFLNMAFDPATMSRWPYDDEADAAAVTDAKKNYINWRSQVPEEMERYRAEVDMDIDAKLRLARRS